MIKAKELRSRSIDDLEKMLKDERARLRDLNFKLAGSQIKNTSEFGKSKRNIAILLTVINEIKKNV